MVKNTLTHAPTYTEHKPGAHMVYVISDSLGDTAADVALAAASQFPTEQLNISRLPKASDIMQVKRFLDEAEKTNPPQLYGACSIVVFYTIADPVFRSEVEWELERREISGLDLLGPAVNLISCLTGMAPSGKSGAIRDLDARYFRRIDSMEYTIAHDDGRIPEEVTQADIVLIGVSRTSKTPLSIYLAFQGYRVANIPLAVEMEPPAELFEVEPYKIFGLLSTPEVLASIRHRRLATDEARMVAGRYAEPEMIEAELRHARDLMRRLGCIVIHTENRAIEETAHEILSYYEAALLARKKIG